jgi:hypothetical protein
MRVNEENFNISKNNPIYQWGLHSTTKPTPRCEVRDNGYMTKLGYFERGDIIAFIKNGGRLIAFGTYNHHIEDPEIGRSIGWNGEGWNILISCDNIYECDIEFRCWSPSSIIYWEFGSQGSRLKQEYGNDYLSNHYNDIVSKQRYGIFRLLLNPFCWSSPREGPIQQTTN